MYLNGIALEMNLLETPDSGTIHINGDCITDKDCDIKRVRSKIGMVFQHFHLFAHMTVLENLCYAPVKVLKRPIAEVRDQANLDSVEVLVDCSIADLPMTQYYAHKVEQYRGSTLLGVLSGGKDRILGSICMETDILATGVSFPEFPKCGDKLIFCGAGAYNSSMAWPFARGNTRD